MENNRTMGLILKKSSVAARVLVVSMIVWLGFSVAVSYAQSSAETPDEARIVFLHLRADHSGVSLIDHIIADGELKIPKVPPRHFGMVCQAQRTGDDAFFEVIVDNPLKRRYEYEDPDNPGQLLSKVVILDEAEFWVRIPFRTDLTQAVFSLRESSVAPKVVVEESVIDLGFLYERGEK